MAIGSFRYGSTVASLKMRVYAVGLRGRRKDLSQNNLVALKCDIAYVTLRSTPLHPPTDREDSGLTGILACSLPARRTPRIDQPRTRLEALAKHILAFVDFNCRWQSCVAVLFLRYSAGAFITNQLIHYDGIKACAMAFHKGIAGPSARVCVARDEPGQHR